MQDVSSPHFQIRVHNPSEPPLSLSGGTGGCFYFLNISTILAPIIATGHIIAITRARQPGCHFAKYFFKLSLNIACFFADMTCAKDWPPWWMTVMDGS